MSKKTLEIMNELKGYSNPEYKQGMKRFAITCKKALGVQTPITRAMGKKYSKELNEVERNKVAQELWNKGYNESKILAVRIATPKIGWKVIENWIMDCENWAQVDVMCMDLLWKIKNADKKIIQYSKAKHLWKKRTAFALIAVFAVRFKNEIPKKDAQKYFELIERESKDERNFIKKAVNWALRQMGKSAPKYYKQAYALSKKLKNSKDKTQHWIGQNAVTEFDSLKKKKLAK